MVPHPDDANGPLKMGFREGDAEKLLLASFRTFPLRRMPKRTQDEKVGKNGLDDKKCEEKGGTAPKNAAIKKEKEGTKENSIVRLTEEGKQIPVGNGGCSLKRGYQWTQTIEEISVLIPIAKETRGKDLNVDIHTSSVSVKYKNESGKSILEGSLHSKIRKSESTWSIEGGVIILNLEKLKKGWWDTAFEGDEAIDTTLIDSTRKIGTYDEATQAKLRKLLFDENQLRQGLPTSDEILGVKPDIPPLPKGVEYIDSSTLDKIATKK